MNNHEHRIDECSNPDCELHSKVRAINGSTPKSEANETDTSISWGENGEYEIKPLKQQSDYDCGQTCLEMLGYNNIRDIYPKKELIARDLHELAGAQAVEAQNADFTTPHMMLIENKQIGRHWIVRINGKVICPVRGVFDADDFEKRFVEKTIAVAKVNTKLPLQAKAA